jgi:hypothetical protein
VLFHWLLSHNNGYIIGEQRFVTFGMDTLAIPANSLRLSQRFLTIDAVLHGQLFVFLQTTPAVSLIYLSSVISPVEQGGAAKLKQA